MLAIIQTFFQQTMAPLLYCLVVIAFNILNKRVPENFHLSILFSLAFLDSVVKTRPWYLLPQGSETYHLRPLASRFWDISFEITLVDEFTKLLTIWFWAVWFLNCTRNVLPLYMYVPQRYIIRTFGIIRISNNLCIQYYIYPNINTYT